MSICADHCFPDYIVARQPENVVTIGQDDLQPSDYWIKSHPQYPSQGVSSKLDCYVSFIASKADVSQEIKFKVLKSTLSGDSYLAFGNDYGDLER